MSEEEQDTADISRDLKQTSKRLDLNEIKRLIKDNRPSPPSLGLKEVVAVVAVVVIAVAVCLTYTANDDIATRQRDILNKIRSLHIEMGKNADKLEKALGTVKTEALNVVKASSEHATKLTRIENSIKHLESRLKPQSSSTKSPN